MPKMDETVYLLWFVQERDQKEDTELLIGVYESKEAAKEAVTRLSNKRGFRDHPEGFQIHSRKIGQDSWTEGFVYTD
jgi:hypothetical protein